MRNRKKRTQREEVRKILATMRLELAAQRLAREQGAPRHDDSSDVLRLNEIINDSIKLVTS